MEDHGFGFQFVGQQDADLGLATRQKRCPSDPERSPVTQGGERMTALIPALECFDIAPFDNGAAKGIEAQSVEMPAFEGN